MELAIVLCVLAALFTYLCVPFGRDLVRSIYLSRKIQGLSWWEIVTKHIRKLLTSDMLTCLCELCESYNYEPWGAWVYLDYSVVVSDPDTIKEVYKLLPNKTHILYNKIRKCFGCGILDINGDDSRRHRKIVHPAFRKNLLESNLPKINQEAAKLVEKIQDVAGKNVNLETLIEDTVLDISLWLLSPGLRSNHSNRSLGKAIRTGMYLIHLETVNPAYYWLVHKWRKSGRESELELKAMLLEFNRMFEEQKRECAKKFSDPDSQPTNPFEFMLQANLGMGGNKLSDKEFLADCAFLLIAAFEATGISTYFSLLLMAVHPDVQQRVFDELNAIFGQSNRNVEMEDLSKMIYLECVIKETLRLFPPAVIIGKIVEEETTINGLLLPKGCSVFINNMALNRNPNNFKDPSKFSPERFFPGSEDHLPSVYHPFSYGVRHCPGQFQAYLILKTLLCYIIRNFQVCPGDGFKGIEDIKVKITISLKLRRRIALRLIARKSM